MEVTAHCVQLSWTANALPGADSITVPAGTYELTLTGVLST